MKLSILLLAAILSGCATCDRHPTACNAVVIGAGVIAIGALSASEWHKGGCTAGCQHTMFKVPVR